MSRKLLDILSFSHLVKELVPEVPIKQNDGTWVVYILSEDKIEGIEMSNEEYEHRQAAKKAGEAFDKTLDKLLDEDR